jgi:hypothetical protein
MSTEHLAWRAAELALSLVADRAHVLAGAAGARPGQRDGALSRPAGVTLVPSRTDPADPAVFTAQFFLEGPREPDSQGERAGGPPVCGGRFDQARGGIAGGRASRRTDTDLLVYLAGLAARAEPDWLPFFDFFSPRSLTEGPGEPLIVWGEDCRGRRHFDAAGLVNWCLETAAGGRDPISLDAAGWAGDTSATEEVPLAAEFRPGDLVLDQRAGPEPGLGILVAAADGGSQSVGGSQSAGEPAAGAGPRAVVLAADTAAGVVCRPFRPAEWTRRRRPSAALLHD